jgi:hypothetical protein
MRRIVLTFGLIAGAVLSAMMLVTIPFMDRIGFDRAMVIGYASMVLGFLMVYFGIRSYRDEVAGGHVTFGRALTVGLLITVVASVCYVATWQVVYHRVAPDFMEQYAAHEIAKARRSGATEAEVAAKAREMAEFSAMYQNPLFNAGFTFLEPLPVGVLLSLVSAGMLSRRRRVGAPALA